jgi:GGDEF domain-containing protein
MRVFDQIPPSDLDRRESQLTLFACIAIGILSIGTAAMMYPVAFSPQSANSGTGEKTLRMAFYGFCALSLLLSGYLWDRQRVIQRLRREMLADRRRVADSQKQASLELLKTLPKANSFQDRLPMEFRRTASTTHKLSILVVMLTLPDGVSLTGDGTVLLGDAAKVISRRLREQDSIYMLGQSCFCAILPGEDMPGAQQFSARLNEGLSDAAGAANRFSFKIEIINYPQHALSSTALEQAVLSLLPTDDSVQGMALAIN